MELGRLLFEAFRSAGEEPTLIGRSPESVSLFRVEGEYELQRVAEAFTTALHRQEERKVLGQEPLTVQELQEAMRRVLAPRK